MARSISWKKPAEDQLDEVLHYWMTEFSKQSATTLYLAIDKKLNTLIRHPESGQYLVEFPAIRYVQIRKSHYLYYTFDDETLFVLAFHGTKSEDNPFL